MKRAKPEELKAALEIANTLAVTGLDFVCIPVRADEIDYKISLIQLQRERLTQFLAEVEDEEGNS